MRGSVLMRRCSSPESPIAVRAAFRRVVSAASDAAPVPDGVDEVVLADDALLVVDQVFDQIEYLRRDGDDLRSAMKLAPVGIECVVLEEIAQAAISLTAKGRRARSSDAWNAKNKLPVRKK